MQSDTSTRESVVSATINACPRKEAIFDSTNSLVLYRKVMELEEYGIIGLEAGKEPEEDQLPPEEYRIVKIEIPPLPSTREGTTVNFFTKPNGLDESYRAKAVFLPFENPKLVRWYVEFLLDYFNFTNRDSKGLMENLVPGSYEGGGRC
jgi:hypothetical protein